MDPQNAQTTDFGPPRARDAKGRPEASKEPLREPFGDHLGVMLEVVCRNFEGQTIQKTQKNYTNLILLFKHSVD